MNSFEHHGESRAEEAGATFLAQVPNILRDRKWWILTALLIGTLAAAVTSLVVPVQYKAEAIMLVEAPQLPEEVLNQTDVDVIDRRIARIKQRITSRPDLVAMIERHNIYADRRGNDSMSEIIEDMRDEIEIAPTVSDAASGALSETIAFTLSFSYEDPVAAQAVAQDLMERILQLDARGSVEQATNTVDFLEERASRLEDQIATIEGQINDIKRRNGMSLSDGGLILSGGQGSYDVQIGALQRDNQALISQRRAAQSADNRNPIVAAAERELAAARSVYSETHPDVVLARQKLAEARELAKSAGPSGSEINDLTRQIEFNNSQIAALQAAKAREESRLNSQIAAQSRAPLVQQQVANLERRLTGFTEQYEEVSAQLTSARTGVQAEDERMTERLTVVEAPITPERPSSPNYLLILAVGVVGGLAVGVGLAFAVELFFRPIRDPQSLEALLGASPIGVIPVVDVLKVADDAPTRHEPGRLLRWLRLAR
ncbi:GumC family protein [Qipengyuania sphaerica]|uniref:GumC family protein n=1 Tax=Qipengyuania sphaerica TaxID=2867243 RepID=UPI001C87F379|nr:Wzz/FepE/Etk N-terminal domain-containing protein [Qipengyuania sphaerica]MBX7539391.1 lipopolysaccharide biosynthesis protein [Qipengyuania sphaerica]